MNIKEKLVSYAEMTQNAIETYLPQCHTEFPAYDRLCEAMRYSLLAGGKRIRAALCLEFCRICGGKAEDALPFACAVEMVHAYSLIHDDLPCMDDDELRRGKPSCHIAFDEATALLAGDALQTCAFETALKAQNIPADRVILATRLLAECAGREGMCGGQSLDLEAETVPADEKTLIRIDETKTGKMIIAAALMGCYAGGANEEKLSAAYRYADGIGRVFQMVDDVLDETATVEDLGKPIGSDKECHKTTYTTLFGVEETMKKATALNEQAKKELDVFGEDADFLRQLADELLVRKK